MRQNHGKNKDDNGGGGSGGLMAQLRRPPGGRDARIMLFAQCLDRIGSGMWSASSVLYFTFVKHMDAQHLGLLLGVAGVAGIAGSPIAGRLAAHIPVRTLLMVCHFIRLGTICLLLLCSGFWELLPVVAVTSMADRGSRTLDMVFATRVAGDRRSTYQALSRSASNAGTALGAGIAAIGLAVGTLGAYQALILGNALSFLATGLLVARTREPDGGPARRTRTLIKPRAAGPASATTTATAEAQAHAPTTRLNPWRDRGYLLFVLRDIPMNLDDGVLNIGLPLWLVNHTKAPHAFIPIFLVLNTVLVVVLQMRVSAQAEGPRRATVATVVYGGTMFVCCLVLATATGGGALSASIAMLVAAVLVTMAELMRSVSSWELAVSLAPPSARAPYLGVAGMSQSIQKSAGPLLLTGAVMVAGPAGWIVFGASIAGLSLVQRRACSRRLDEMAAAVDVPEAVQPSGAAPLTADAR